MPVDAKDLSAQQAAGRAGRDSESRRCARAQSVVPDHLFA